MAVILEWAITWVQCGILKDFSVIAMVDILCQLLHHSLEPKCRYNNNSAGFVVVAGLYLMVMVGRMLRLIIVDLVAADKVVWAVADL
jgi:hypothetical protein